MNRATLAAGTLALALALAAASCGSGPARSAVGTGGSPTSQPPSSTPSSTTSTVAPQLPTVPNCGGGAFEPKTLLFVCGTGTGTGSATGVSWRSWGPAAASGSGTVQLAVNGRPASAPATLTLGHVVEGPVGLQFSRLTVTWSGSPPDGRHQDTYQLEMQG